MASSRSLHIFGMDHSRDGVGGHCLGPELHHLSEVLLLSVLSLQGQGVEGCEGWISGKRKSRQKVGMTTG